MELTPDGTVHVVPDVYEALVYDVDDPVESPSDALLRTRTTPAETLVMPEYVLVPESVSVEELVVLLSAPAPEMTPESSCVADDA
jgi:hypothetical protein